ncbi:hypothetical protein FHU38_003685 [Saccharomonospora amisosensis]|uniref:Uncharacterized protein n=1 Tax=Saccharomonospora amisosensis TaxID=1128677 RepID=A0A7X5USC4_9PSEU|nr:hypothetical protein [Saccharomonospora amisosensis]NIJ13341.1 hypothetical protein [Saccharomonospora amisosensis]
MPGRRALTYDEVRSLFDAADDRAEQIRRRGWKGAPAALRDAARLDLADFRCNAPEVQAIRVGAGSQRQGITR